jgi:protease-4
MSVATDDSIKGIVFFISSPGGTVTGARAIADGVSYYKEKTGKPVYAYVQDMAASGAYWAAAATDKIYAEQGSLTGSIGVLMGPFEYYDKLVSLGSVGTENGISITYITGGEFKDFGNPTKKMSEEELAIMQKGINTEYDKFVAYVSERRQIPVHVIKEDIKALIYGADEAKAYNLIDEIGNREQVISALASKAGLSDYEVVKEGASTTLFGSLFSSIVHPISLETAKTTTRTCYLCNRVLYLYGNPLAF